jgi:hypothetical protein
LGRLKGKTTLIAGATSGAGQLNLQAHNWRWPGEMRKRGNAGFGYPDKIAKVVLPLPSIYIVRGDYVDGGMICYDGDVYSRIWREEAEPDNPFATQSAYCRGYDVYGDMIHGLMLYHYSE